MRSGSAGLVVRLTRLPPHLPTVPHVRCHRLPTLDTGSFAPVPATTALHVTGYRTLPVRILRLVAYAPAFAFCVAQRTYRVLVWFAVCVAARGLHAPVAVTARHHCMVRLPYARCRFCCIPVTFFRFTFTYARAHTCHLRLRFRLPLHHRVAVHTTPHGSFTTHGCLRLPYTLPLPPHTFAGLRCYVPVARSTCLLPLHARLRGSLPHSSTAAFTRSLLRLYRTHGCRFTHRVTFGSGLDYVLRLLRLRALRLRTAVAFARGWLRYTHYGCLVGLLVGSHTRFAGSVIYSLPTVTSRAFSLLHRIHTRSSPFTFGSTHTPAVPHLLPCRFLRLRCYRLQFWFCGSAVPFAAPVLYRSHPPPRPLPTGSRLLVYPLRDFTCLRAHGCCISRFWLRFFCVLRTRVLVRAVTHTTFARLLFAAHTTAYAHTAYVTCTGYRRARLPHTPVTTYRLVLQFCGTYRVYVRLPHTLPHAVRLRAFTTAVVIRTAFCLYGSTRACGCTHGYVAGYLPVRYTAFSNGWFCTPRYARAFLQHGLRVLRSLVYLLPHTRSRLPFTPHLRSTRHVATVTVATPSCPTAYLHLRYLVLLRLPYACGSHFARALHTRFTRIYAPYRGHALVGYSVLRFAHCTRTHAFTFCSSRAHTTVVCGSHTTYTRLHCAVTTHRSTVTFTWFYTVTTYLFLHYTCGSLRFLPVHGYLVGCCTHAVAHAPYTPFRAHTFAWFRGCRCLHTFRSRFCYTRVLAVYGLLFAIYTFWLYTHGYTHRVTRYAVLYGSGSHT